MDTTQTTPRPPCKRCDGTGILPCYDHVAGGHCFTCEGTGRQLRVAAAPKAITFGRWTITLTDNRNHYAVLVTHPEIDSRRENFDTLAAARTFANDTFRTIRATEAPAV